LKAAPGKFILNTLKVPFYLICCQADERRYLKLKAKAFRLAARWDLYERQHVRWLQRFLRPGMTALDIGAHLGVYTRILSDAVGPSGKVIAFEPYSPAREILDTQFSAVSNVTVYGLALGATDRGEVGYVVPKLFGIVPEAALGHVDNKNQPSSISISFARLDSLPLNLERLDFLKIDVEGSEPAVLEGGRETIKRFRPLIMFEDNDIPQRVAYYRQLAKELQYLVCRLAKNGLLEILADQIRQADLNYFLAPQELRASLVESHQACLGDTDYG